LDKKDSITLNLFGPIGKSNCLGELN